MAAQCGIPRYHRHSYKALSSRGFQLIRRYRASRSCLYSGVETGAGRPHKSAPWDVAGFNEGSLMRDRIMSAPARTASRALAAFSVVALFAVTAVPVSL